MKNWTTPLDFFNNFFSKSNNFLIFDHAFAQIYKMLGINGMIPESFFKMMPE